MKKNSSLVLLMILLLVAGVFLGTSITTFILFLRKSDHLLAVISYLCLGIFTLTAIISIYLVYRFRRYIIKTPVDEDLEDEKE